MGTAIYTPKRAAMHALSDWPAGGSPAVAALALAWAASVLYILRKTPRRARPAHARQRAPRTVVLWHTLSLETAPKAVAALLPLQLMALTSAWWRSRALARWMHLTRLRGRTRELRPWPRVPALRAGSQHSSRHGCLPVMVARTRRVRAAGGRETKVAPHRRGACPPAASSRARPWRDRSWTSARKPSSSMGRRRCVFQPARYQPGMRARVQDARPGAARAQTLLSDATQPPRVVGAPLLTRPARVWNVGGLVLQVVGALLLA